MVKKLIIKHLRAEYFLPNIFAPLFLLSLYNGVFVCISYIIFPRGANLYYAANMWKYLLLVILILIIIHLFFIVVFNFIKRNKLKLAKSTEQMTLSDLFLILLPLTPIVQYLLQNREILSIIDGFFLLTFFGLFSAIFIVFIPYTLRKFISVRSLTSVGAAFTLTITNMASLVNNSNWLREARFEIPLIFFCVSLFLIYISNTAKTKTLLNGFIVANLIVNSLLSFESQVIKFNAIPSTNKNNHLLEKIDDRVLLSKPNIYFMIYESYVPSETLIGYGIDNSLQEDYLRNSGFQIYDDIYTVGSPTVASISRVLNASTNFFGNVRNGVSGDGLVHQTFRQLGYSTYGIFPDDYLFYGIGSRYDITVPMSNSPASLPSFALLTRAILLGEFRIDLLFNELTHEQFVDAKHRVIDNMDRDPAFIYSHSDVPGHSQYLGGCLPDEYQKYKKNLEKANHEMRMDIELISEVDPTAIIIISGDHGPYLTKSCFDTSKDYDKSQISRLDIQDRFGTFLAIKWPSVEFSDYDDITVLQDLFPVIFAYLYQDIGFLDLKISPDILDTHLISGVSVKDGIIFGGMDDGKPLFNSE